MCGNCAWDSNCSIKTDSIVFMVAAVAQTKFVSYRCGHHNAGVRCPGTLHVDGKEYGVLRSRADVAFGHCLLYGWMNRMCSGGVKWWRFWRDTLMAYTT